MLTRIFSVLSFGSFSDLSKLIPLFAHNHAFREQPKLIVRIEKAFSANSSATKCSRPCSYEAASRRLGGATLTPLPPAQHDSHNPESGHGNEDGAILFEGGLNQKKAGHDNSHHSPNLIKEPCRNKNRGRKQRPEIRLCENLEGEPKEKEVQANQRQDNQPLPSPAV